MKASDSWRTPDWLFEKLSKELGPFDIDLCATAENSKCVDYYIDYLSDYLHERSISPHDCNHSECKLGKIKNHLSDLNCKIAFMNPPYSNPLPFIEKAWEDSKYCKIVCLLKCDPSTKWWAVFWEYDKVKKEIVGCTTGGFGFPGAFREEETLYNGPKPGCEVIFLPKRVKFDPPIGYTGKVSSPSFPSCVVIMDRREC